MIAQVLLETCQLVCFDLLFLTSFGGKKKDEYPQSHYEYHKTFRMSYRMEFFEFGKQIRLFRFLLELEVYD